MAKEVVVIDDECDIADVVKLALEQAGYEVVPLCQDVSGAISLIKEVRPELVILDIRMPQINGWTILDQMRRNDETSQIPVVLTTGMPEDTVQAAHVLTGGKTELLLKPFDLDDLVRKVEHMIGKP